MAPGKLNPTSQPLAPSTATFDAPGSSFSSGNTNTGLLEQNKPAVSSSTSKAGSSRSSSPHTGAATDPNSMSPTSAASGGWFGGWGRSKSAAARPITHTRSKSWFGGGKKTTSGERGRNAETTTKIGAADLGNSSNTNTTTTDVLSHCNSTTGATSGRVSGGDNDTSGDLGSDTEETGLGAAKTENSSNTDTIPIDIATESTPDQKIQEKEGTEQVQLQPTTFRAPYRNLSLEELRSFKYKSSGKDLEAENVSLKEKLRASFEAQLSSQRERDLAMDDCKRSRDTVKQLEEAVSSLQATNRRLLIENASFKESSEAVNKEVSSMRTAIDELKADNTSLKESKELEISSLQTTINELKAENTSSKESKELEISSLHTTICVLKAEATSLNESREALEDALATERKLGQQNLEDARQALEMELNTANSHITNLKNKETTLQDSLQSIESALTEEKLRSRELGIRLEERRASETKLESYLRSELEKYQTLALQRSKDLEKLREDHMQLQLASVTPDKSTKKHKITKNDSQRLSEQNSELMRQLQHARAQSKQLAIDLAAMEKKSEVEGSKSKFSLRDIVRRPTNKNDTSRPLTSHGRPFTSHGRPLTSRADRRSMFV